MLASTIEEIRANLMHILDDIVQSRQYLNKHFQNSMNNYFLENYSTLPSLKRHFDTQSGRQVRKEIFDKYSQQKESEGMLKCFLIMKGFVEEHRLNNSIDEYRKSLASVSKAEKNENVLKDTQEWISLQWRRLFALMVLHHTYFVEIQGVYELWYHVFGERLIARERQKKKKDEMQLRAEIAPYIILQENTIVKLQKQEEINTTQELTKIENEQLNNSKEGINQNANKVHSQENLKKRKFKTKSHFKINPRKVSKQKIPKESSQNGSQLTSSNKISISIKSEESKILLNSDLLEKQIKVTDVKYDSTSFEKSNQLEESNKIEEPELCKKRVTQDTIVIIRDKNQSGYSLHSLPNSFSNPPSLSNSIEMPHINYQSEETNSENEQQVNYKEGTQYGENGNLCYFQQQQMQNLSFDQSFQQSFQSEQIMQQKSYQQIMIQPQQNSFYQPTHQQYQPSTQNYHYQQNQPQSSSQLYPSQYATQQNQSMQSQQYFSQQNEQQQSYQQPQSQTYVSSSKINDLDYTLACNASSETHLDILTTPQPSQFYELTPPFTYTSQGQFTPFLSLNSYNQHQQTKCGNLGCNQRNPNFYGASSVAIGNGQQYNTYCQNNNNSYYNFSNGNYGGSINNTPPNANNWQQQNQQYPSHQYNAFEQQQSSQQLQQQYSNYYVQ